MLLHFLGYSRELLAPFSSRTRNSDKPSVLNSVAECKWFSLGINVSRSGVPFVKSTDVLTTSRILLSLSCQWTGARSCFQCWFQNHNNHKRERSHLLLHTCWTVRWGQILLGYLTIAWPYSSIGQVFLSAAKTHTGHYNYNNNSMA